MRYYWIVLGVDQEACELRYPIKTSRVLTAVCIATLALVAVLLQGAMRTESGSAALGATVFAILGAAMSLSLLRARRWLGERVVAGPQSLDFVGHQGCSVSMPWNSIDSLRFHRLTMSSIPYFSVRARARRPIARIYLNGEGVGPLLEVIALRIPMREPPRLPIVLERRGWLGAGLRLMAALAPLALVAVFLGRNGAEATAWAFAGLGAVCSAGYLGVLYISPLSTRIGSKGILVRRRFKGDIDVRYEDLESVHLDLPFGRAGGGPRITIVPRTRRAFFLDTTAERSVTLFPVIRGLLDEVTQPTGSAPP